MWGDGGENIVVFKRKRDLMAAAVVAGAVG